MLPQLLVILLPLAQAALLSTPQPDQDGIAKMRSEGHQVSDEHCQVLLENQPVHELMERVCSHCHEYFSDSVANLRFECRSNCFQNKRFEQCLSLFAPEQSGTTHRARRHLGHRKRIGTKA
ncbi:unnamed protein product, partial [Mesorhabditis spiculigera]